jgi:hypothetical protein
MPTKIDNTPINNAHRGLRVKIDTKNISNGRRLDPDACAAANALCNMAGVEAAKVHRHCVYIKRRGKWERYRTSSALRLETIIFDRGGAFIPGEYDLLAMPISRIIPKKRQPRTNGAHTQKSQRGGFGALGKPQYRAYIPGTRATANGQQG